MSIKNSTPKKNPVQNVITTDQILEAYAAHGDDLVVINLESMRKYKEFAQYIDIDIRLADGSVTGVRYWKMSESGIINASRLRKPEQRKYESIRMAIALNDEDGENDNAKALMILCNAVEATLAKMKDNKIITDDKRAPRKQADGSMSPVHLINTSIVTPMQTTRMTKDGDNEELENPLFWISIPKKKFFGNGQTARPSVQFEDKCYADETGQPDVERPVMSYEFAPTFYNLDDFYHNPRSDKKIHKRLGSVDPMKPSDNHMDNTNIQDYLTKGSAILGNFKFELAVSGRQCKFDVSLYGTNTVRVAEVVENSEGGQNDDRVDAFSSRYANLGAAIVNQNIDDYETHDNDE